MRNECPPTLLGGNQINVFIQSIQIRLWDAEAAGRHTRCESDESALNKCSVNPFCPQEDQGMASAAFWVGSGTSDFQCYSGIQYVIFNVIYATVNTAYCAL